MANQTPPKELLPICPIHKSYLLRRRISDTDRRMIWWCAKHGCGYFIFTICKRNKAFRKEYYYRREEQTGKSS